LPPPGPDPAAAFFIPPIACLPATFLRDAALRHNNAALRKTQGGVAVLAVVMPARLAYVTPEPANG